MTTPEPVRLPDVADIETQLANFWRQASSDDQAVVRASTHNLIVVCETGDDVARATEAVAVLSEQHPGRVIVVCTEPAGDGSSELDAFVTTHCHLGSGGNRVCSEQVTLKARGPAGVDLVPETVLQLLEGDCPVYTWWRRPELATDPLWEPLARLSDRCIVNSATAADPVGVLGDLAALARTDAARGSRRGARWSRPSSIRP